MLPQPLLLSRQPDKKSGDLDLNQLQSFVNMILIGMEQRERERVENMWQVLLLSQILNKWTEEVLYFLKVQTSLYTNSVFPAR